VGGEDRKKSLVGIELVRQLAAEGDRIFTAARARELCSRVDLKESYLLEALHHLTRDGWIVRLRRGLYAISSPVPGVSAAHEFEVPMHLVDPAAISHWSAMQYHDLTDQMPGRVFVLTTTDSSVPRARGRRAEQADGGYPVAGTIYRFVQVKPERFFGTGEVWVGEARITITDPERTLIDGLTMPHYCGDFSEVLSAFQMRGDEVNLDRIIEYALRLDKVTAKRLGWVLENLGIAEEGLEELQDVPVSRYQPLDPSGPRKGPCDAKWMIQENLPGRIGR
jgi:predicted transcriptional regulator of viral defense system